MTNEQPWRENLRGAIASLTAVQKDADAGKLKAAHDYLSAAKRVEDAILQLQPVSRNTTDEPALSVVGALVHEARNPTDGRAATWGEVALSFEMQLPQRAFDRWGPNKKDRLANGRERVARHRDPSVTPRSASDLPGLSAAEAEEHFGFSRTKLRAWVAEQKVHAFHLSNDDGAPVTVRRNGKDVPSLRYYLQGVSVKEAAAALDVSETEVAELGAKGLIGRSLILNPDTLEPVLDASGNQVWQYFPDHRSPAAE